MTRAVGAPLAARTFAVVGLTAAVVGAVGAITLRIVDPVPAVPDRFGFSDVALVGFAIMGVAFASVGALLVVRRPRNAIGWCMVLLGAGHAVGILAAAATFSLVAIGTESALRTAQVTGWFTTLFITLGGILFGIGFIFPTGRGHTPRWDLFVRFSLISGPALLLMTVLQPGPLSIFPTIENPFGLGPDLRVVVGVQFSDLIIASAFALPLTIAWSLISRYRRADATERQQMKWFALAIVMSIGGMAVSAFGAFLARNPPEIGLAVFGFAGALVPIAIGIAILRYRLYEIDRIISRTLAYALVTAVLVAVFGGLVLGLQTVLAPLTQDSTIAVAASTLVVFALFQPVRRGIQRAVDRRFHRARIDAERTTEAFASRLRDQMDLDVLGHELVTTVDRSLQPSASAIWLRRTNLVTNSGRSAPTLGTP